MKISEIIGFFIGLEIFGAILHAFVTKDSIYKSDDDE